jgi:chromate reductase
MNNELNILAISGSLRADSYNTASLRAAQKLAPEGVNIDIADISGIPMYNQDQSDQNVTSTVESLSAKILAADALLFATPEYNYSIPGVLKNTIDWLSRQDPQPLAGKPAAVMSASISLFGGARAQYDLRRIMIYLDVHFINKPEVMIASAHERFDTGGELTDTVTAEFIAQLVTALADWTRQLRAR